MHDKAKKVVIFEVITAAVIVSLPVDLLYLYFAGGWNEPNHFILGVELGVLFLLPLFGIWQLYDFVRAKRKKAKGYQEGKSSTSVTKLPRRHYFLTD